MPVEGDMRKESTTYGSPTTLKGGRSGVSLLDGGLIVAPFQGGLEHIE